MVTSYRDLEVWQLSMAWVVRIYRLADTLPDDERFGLQSQLRRAAVSVPANIAEGAGRDHTGDYLRHVSIAMGSLAEVETLIQIAIDLEYAPATRCDDLLETSQQIGRMLRGLQKSLKRRRSDTSP
ncbi:MAG: four helix bundle protein [Planctomycetota bacterium]